MTGHVFPKAVLFDAEAVTSIDVSGIAALREVRDTLAAQGILFAIARARGTFLRMLVRSGITLIKYWFSITDEEQHLRFLGRIHDPLKQWKLSPMDLESRVRWEAYTKAKETMLERTHIPEAPWWVVQAVDKKKARLNCIAHLLGQLPYAEVPHPPVVLPERVRNPEYLRQPVPASMYVPEVY